MTKLKFWKKSSFDKTQTVIKLKLCEKKNQKLKYDKTQIVTVVTVVTVVTKKNFFSKKKKHKNITIF